MNRLFPSTLTLLVALLLGACGGGDGNEPVDEYEPALDTWQQASEAYARGIENSDADLLEFVLAPDEKAKLATFKTNFNKSKEQGLAWRIEFPKSRELEKDRAAVLAWIYMTEDGEEKIHQKSWIIFKKIKGKWYYSPQASKDFVEELERKAGNDQPADDGEAASDAGTD